MISHYDPTTRKVNLAPNASLYARLHEEAHHQQHESNELVFRVWLHTHWIIGLGRLSNIWIEIDAYRRTKGLMTKLGVWNAASAYEAKRSLLTYFRRKTT